MGRRVNWVERVPSRSLHSSGRARCCRCSGEDEVKGVSAEATAVVLAGATASELRLAEEEGLSKGRVLRQKKDVPHTLTPAQVVNLRNRKLEIKCAHESQGQGRVTQRLVANLDLIRISHF